MILLLSLPQAELGLFPGFLIRRLRLRSIVLSRRKFSWMEFYHPWAFFEIQCLPLIITIIRRQVEELQVIRVKPSQTVRILATTAGQDEPISDDTGESF